MNWPCSPTLTSLTASSPDIEITPDSWHFGPLTIGDYEDKVFTITNNSSETLSGSASGISPPYSFTSGTSYSISPGGTDSVTVRFRPTSTASGPNHTFLHFSGGGGLTLVLTGELGNYYYLVAGAAMLRDIFIEADTNENHCVEMSEANEQELGTSEMLALYPNGTECWSVDELLVLGFGEIKTRNSIYVSFDTFQGSTLETGQTDLLGFNQLLEAFEYVSHDGSGNIYVAGEETFEVFAGTYSLDPAGKVTLNATDGTVRIGVPISEARGVNRPVGFVTR